MRWIYRYFEMKRENTSRKRSIAESAYKMACLGGRMPVIEWLRVHDFRLLRRTNSSVVHVVLMNACASGSAEMVEWVVGYYGIVDELLQKILAADLDNNNRVEAAGISWGRYSLFSHICATTPDTSVLDYLAKNVPWYTSAPHARLRNLIEESLFAALCAGNVAVAMWIYEHNVGYMIKSDAATRMKAAGVVGWMCQKGHIEALLWFSVIFGAPTEEEITNLLVDVKEIYDHQDVVDYLLAHLREATGADETVWRRSCRQANASILTRGRRFPPASWRNDPALYDPEHIAAFAALCHFKNHILKEHGGFVMRMIAAYAEDFKKLEGDGKAIMWQAICAAGFVGYIHKFAEDFGVTRKEAIADDCASVADMLGGARSTGVGRDTFKWFVEKFKLTRDDIVTALATTAQCLSPRPEFWHFVETDLFPGLDRWEVLKRCA
jgi:hypothetical protein